MQGNLYSIKIASKRSGLSTHVIRSWERRYGAITPIRTKTNRRLFSEKDIEKLSLLNKIVSNGHSISNVANLEIDNLQHLLKNSSEISDLDENSYSDNKEETIALKTKTYIDKCYEHIVKMNQLGLEKLLKNASTDFGSFYVIVNIVSPILNLIGDNWKKGVLRVCHEHLATEVIKSYLKNIMYLSNTTINSPKIIVTTPKGQMHDVGATIVAATCALEGWEVIYLGANLSSEEISGAVKQNEAKALALSIVYPEDDAVLIQELRNIRELVDSKTRIFAGGRCCNSYSKNLNDLNIEFISELISFRDKLQSITA